MIKRNWNDVAGLHWLEQNKRLVRWGSGGIKEFSPVGNNCFSKRLLVNETNFWVFLRLVKIHRWKGASRRVGENICLARLYSSVPLSLFNLTRMTQTVGDKRPLLPYLKKLAHVIWKFKMWRSYKLFNGNLQALPFNVEQRTPTWQP